jgi:ribulose-phosphate 3-epimerase
MIVDPDRYLQDFKLAGAENITVHIEACTHLNRTMHAIKDLGCKAGVAVNPHTPISLLEDSIEDIDIVCLMSVNPGFGGQKFIDNTYKKIKELRLMASGRNNDLLIEIDGGVSHQNALKLLQAGANVLVAGNSVFSAIDPVMEIAALKNINPDLIGG